MFTNLGKTLKNLIIEEDSIAKSDSGDSGQTARQSVTLTIDNNQFTQALRNSIIARPTALTALTATTQKLEAVIKDPTMRIQAAFQMVKSEGRGIKELLDAITVHTADLESQRLQFTRAMDTELKTAVGSL